VSRSRGKRRLLAALCLLGTLLFAALGVWQVERLAWKMDLIARVDARVHAPPAPLRSIDPRDPEYRHVRATGTFLPGKETLVEALTELGPGHWVLTPLRTAEGTILVNRGFVPPEQRSPAAYAPPAGPVTVTGLLRLTEPHGRFLRANRPAEGRWYSRDVEAIAAARGLGAVAPFFIDAGAGGGGGPVGGLTVVTFRNAHLIYALTWFGLTALSLAGLVLLRKEALQRR
jgi:surfeit locus 1 family protein